MELDSTYYAIPPADRVTRWAEQTPETFTISAKVPSSVTHEGQLREETLPELARFFETMRLLGPRLGPLCFQMPPSFVFPRDGAALERTMRALPELGAAGLDLCMEFRHPSWVQRDSKNEIEALLAEWGVAWVWNNWEPNHPKAPHMPRAIEDPQALKTTNDDFGYVRLTGSHAVEIDYRTVVIDRGRDLARWADLVRAFTEGRDGRLIYILLNNHYSGSSLIAMQALRRQLELPDIPGWRSCWKAAKRPPAKTPRHSSAYRASRPPATPVNRTRHGRHRAAAARKRALSVRTHCKIRLSDCSASSFAEALPAGPVNSAQTITSVSNASSSHA